MSLRKKLVSNLFYNFLDIIAVSIISYVFWIILGKTLPPAEYGIVSTIITLALSISIITSLGFGGSLPKFIPQYLTENKSDKIKPLLTFSVKMGLLVSAATGLIFYLFSFSIANSIYINPEMIIPLQLLLPLLVFITIAGILRAGLVGFQKFKQIFVADTVSRLFTISFLIIISLTAISVIEGIFAFLSISVFGLFFFGYYLYKILPEGKKKGISKSYISYSLASSLYGLMQYFIVSGGIILLGFLGTMDGVGFFRVVVLFGTLINLPCAVITSSFIANFSELWSAGHLDKLRAIVEFSIKYTFLMLLPMVIFLTIFSRFFTLLFFSYDYLPATELFLPYLVGMLLYSLSYFAWSFLYYTNEARYLFKAITSCAILSIILSFILIPHFSTIGAAYAFLISQLIFFPVTLYKINKKIKISIKSMRGVLVASSIFLILTYLISLTGKVTTIILMIAMSVIYLVLLLKMKVFGKDDIEVINSLPSLGPLNNLRKKFVKTIEKNM